MELLRSETTVQHTLEFSGDEVRSLVTCGLLASWGPAQLRLTVAKMLEVADLLEPGDSLAEALRALALELEPDITRAHETAPTQTMEARVHILSGSCGVSLCTQQLPTAWRRTHRWVAYGQHEAMVEASAHAAWAGTFTMTPCPVCLELARQYDQQRAALADD
jgi:hypothetical protein